MMWLCHGWGWRPPQTASHFHSGHIQCVWAHWYAIHGHTISALYSYTQPTSWLRICSSGALVESKMMWLCHGLGWQSPQAYSPLHIRHIQLFEHIDMLTIGLWLQPHTVIPTLLGSDFGFGFWVTCGVKMMSLHQGWCWQPPQTASHLHLRHYKVFEYINMLSIGIW